MNSATLLRRFTGLGILSPRLALLAPGLLPGLSATAGEKSGYLLALGTVPIPDARRTPPNDSCGTIAPFAARHYYRDIATALRPLAAELRREAGLPKAGVRIFSNSRLPERSLAAGLGLGWVGKNGLLMNREYGSSFILAGLIARLPQALTEGTASVPLIEELTPPASPHSRCGGCRACVEACPTGAIRPEGGVDPARCLQYLATTPGELPPPAEAVWGRRIYGCQICQEVCPVNRNRSFHAPLLPPGTEHPSLSRLLEEFAQSPVLPLKAILPATALEAGWIPRTAILRNTLVAAGNSGEESLIPLIAPFLKEGPDGPLQCTARRALVRLDG